MNETVLLQMENTREPLPEVKVFHEADLELRTGGVCILLNEDRAGRSILIKVLGGIYTAEEGKTLIDGKKVTIDGVNTSYNNGISVIYQELVLVPHMTVVEDILPSRGSSKGLWISHETAEKEAQQLLGAYHMSIDAGMLIKDLTITQQQMVEIAKVVFCHSRILMVGELTSPISDKEVEFLFSTVRELTEKGVGIIYIPHKMDELEQICDRVTMPRDGTYVGTERVKDAIRDHLIAMMVGRELTRYYTRGYMGPGKVVLKRENIANGKMVKGASFGLREGEIIDLAGLVGVGRSETVKCIFGLTPGRMGDISVEGKKAAIRSSIDTMKPGIVLVPEDRKRGGLYRVQGVRFSFTIGTLKSFIKGIWMDADKEEEITRQYIETMDTKIPSQEQSIGNLSGDNQRKVVIGRWLATAPKIPIPDEPTRGVDVDAKSKIYAITNKLVKKGMSIIIVSSELSEIPNVSDQVYVMCDDRITGCFSHEEYVTQEQIMKLAAKQEKGER